MFFETERDVLLDGLSKAVSLAEKKSSLPILSHVLINATEAELVLTATDLSVGLQTRHPYTLKQEGTVAVPCRKLYEIVKELSPGSVSMELTDGGRIRIASGHGIFELAGMDTADYPAWVAFDAETVSLPAEKLLYLIDKTMFASSNDEARFNLNGVLFEQHEEKIKLVATDGHRLAMIDEDLGMSLPAKRVVVSKKSLMELKRTLDTLKEEVSIGFEPKNMLLKTDRLTMTVRLTEGDYPDYRKVIPKQSDKKLTTDRIRMLQSLRRVSILTSDRNKGITVNIFPGRMELTAVHPDLGTAKDVVDIAYDGPELSLIVNVFYMLDSLSAIDTESISLEFHEEGEPIIVAPEPSKNYFNLVMPMRK